MAKEKKISTKDNGDISTSEMRKLSDANKVSLRIDAKTVILVSKENCNKEYAEAYKKRMEESADNAKFNYTGGR